MKLAAILLILGASFGCFRANPHVAGDPSRAMHGIEMFSGDEGAACTANAIGPHALLTAAHCVVGTSVILVDGDKRQILSISYDEKDHAILFVDDTFTELVEVAPRFLISSEHVYFFGNPGRTKKFRRDGYFLRTQTADLFDFIMLFQLPAFPGDSGSGIIDGNGKLIAVLSIADKSAEVAAFPLEFTPEQLAVAVKGTP